MTSIGPTNYNYGLGQFTSTTASNKSLDVYVARVFNIMNKAIKANKMERGGFRLRALADLADEIGADVDDKSIPAGSPEHKFASSVMEYVVTCARGGLAAAPTIQIDPALLGVIAEIEAKKAREEERETQAKQQQAQQQAQQQEINKANEQARVSRDLLAAADAINRAADAKVAANKAQTGVADLRALVESMQEEIERLTEARDKMRDDLSRLFKDVGDLLESRAQPAQPSKPSKPSKKRK